MPAMLCLLLQELQREYSGPVTAVESLRGYLLMAIGNRIEMHYKQVRTRDGTAGMLAGAPCLTVTFT
jgi:hypothetical protein